MSNKGLGRGFDSLVPQGTSIEGVTIPKHEKIHSLAVDIIKPQSAQPRQHFDESQLEQLAVSIQEQGILQPIIVVEVEHNLYAIIAGERRWRAAKLIGLSHIPAIIKEASEVQQLELALLENIQRADLNPLETAKTIERLHTEFQQSYEDIAKKLGKAYTTVVNTSRLLKLPTVMQDAIINGAISEGHGRALLAVNNQPSVQRALYSTIIKKQLSVRQAEQWVITHKHQVAQKSISPKTTTKQNIHIAQQLTKHIGMPVSVPVSTKKGKVTISYSSKEQLNKIITLLKNSSV